MPSPRPSESPHEAERRKYLPRNYLAHSIEGGLFVGGIAFVAPDSVLPRLAQVIEAPGWIVGMMPALMWIGIGLPSLFVAHRIERVTRYMPLLLVTGIFQRIPFLFAALALMFLADTRPSIVLAAVVLAPLVSGLCGGLAFSAWMELVARTLPANRRASVFAVRNVISSALGLAAGGLIAAVLTRWPGPFGFGVLHLMAFVMLASSYAVFSLIYEPNRPPQNTGPPKTLAENLRGLPHLLRVDRRLHRFIVARVLTMGQFVVVPYMAIHALGVTGRPDSFLGLLVTLQMAGGITGNLFAGWVGDRFGGKYVMIYGNLLLIAVSIGAVLAQTVVHFGIVFFVFGAGFFASRVGVMTLSLEVSPREKRATAIGLMTLLGVFAMVGSSLLSGLVWNLGHGLLPAAIITSLALAAASVLVATVRDPRKARG